MVYNGYYKVMSNLPKMGHLPIPVPTEDMFYRINPEIVQVLTDGELFLLKFTTEMRGAQPG